MATHLRVDPATAQVYPEGWQSWTPTTIYNVDEAPFQPVDEAHRRIGYRSGSTSAAGFVGEGLLAVRPGLGENVRVFATATPCQVPSIRAVAEGRDLFITADGPFEEHATESDDIATALHLWARQFATGVGVGPARPAPGVWCSWYQYFDQVAERDIVENLAAMDTFTVPVDVVQIDDGYQREIGDWREPSERFADLADLVGRIRATGRRAGIWLAPFLAGQRSHTASNHPEWLVPGADAGWNWGQRLAALDTSNEAVQQHLTDVFAWLVDVGIDYFKLDFLYAGAIPGSRRSSEQAIAAYREGLRVIREAIGPDSYLVGCGAPTLASVGLVDALRVSPDTAPHVEPFSGDLSSPGQRSAMMTGRARQWQNRALWLNDPDCLLARPDVANREAWADYLVSVDGLRSVSDRIDTLDEWGLRTTLAYLHGG